MVGMVGTRERPRVPWTRRAFGRFAAVWQVAEFVQRARFRPVALSWLGLGFITAAVWGGLGPWWGAAAGGLSCLLMEFRLGQRG